MNVLSVGKRRGLQQTSTDRQVIAALALDQRGNLRAALRPENPEAVTYGEMVEFKQIVTQLVSPEASAVLLDPVYGAAQAVAGDALPGDVGLIVAIEETGYEGDATARRTALMPGWGVAKVRRMGAQAVKLLLYYHPDSPRASQQEALLDEVIAACRDHDIPLFVEPLSYSLDPGIKNLPSAERRRVVLETARRLTRPGVDILKAEFPLVVQESPDENEWAAACAELTDASAAPWVLLSAGVDFETYVRQVEIACEAGASGVLAGRAVWKEATRLSGIDRAQFLETTARERMRTLTDICNRLARPWTKVYERSEQLDESWYERYPAAGA